MPERIYVSAAGDEWEPLEDEPFLTEDQLQSLIADHPELLDGQQIRPDDPRRWILVTREKGIAETADGGARWALDLLLVDQDAMPTLVEVKRSRNPDARRAVVGQMLEYAAYAVQNWTAAELRRTFEESARMRGLHPDDELGTLLQDKQPDAEDFWQRVTAKLAASEIRLLFVVDDIPGPLRRIVEFLNAQMPALELIAVEIKQFRGAGASTQALAPRVIGRVDKQPNRLSAHTRESFLEALPSDRVRSTAERLLNAAEKKGISPAWRPGGVTIKAPCSRSEKAVAVAWLFVPGAHWRYYRKFTFGSGSADNWPDQTVRDLLVRWAGQFAADGFASPVGGNWVVGYDAATEHVGLLEERLAAVLSELQAL